MLIFIWASTLSACVWIVAWQLDTQAAIAGAIVITLACLGVLTINSMLARTQDRQNL
ncbi:MAG: hypothetical protein RL651_1461 [Pseudomonadota bacterium]|jgi:hypothetical protein